MSTTNPTKYMTVYRAEDSFGAGPFHSGDSHYYNEGREVDLLGYPLHETLGMMPCLKDQTEIDSDAHKHIKNIGYKNMVFGFESIEHLEKAMPCAYGRRAMGTQGSTKIKMFRVPCRIVIKGRTQLIFEERYRYELIGELDPFTLEPIHTKANQT